MSQEGKESKLIEPYRDSLRGTDYATFWERLADRDQTVKWETFFQSEDHVAFSPATSRHGTENVLLAVVIARLSKTPEGQKILERLALKYLDTCRGIIASIEHASQTNWLTALNNQHIAAGISHRIGLLDDGSYIKTMDHYRAVFDKMFTAEILSSTLGSVTTLVQGSKSGGGAEGLGSLAVMLKSLGK
jgi:hypothetical protein